VPIILAAAVALAAMLFAVSCGVLDSNPCRQMGYNLCECEQGTPAQQQCMDNVDQMAFTSAQSLECVNYVATCNCDNYKNAETAKQFCGDVF
jgi:hypothetical protein